MDSLPLSHLGSPLPYILLTGNNLVFLPFHTVHRVLKARILRWLPFPSPVDQVLSELSAMTRPSWVALTGMALGFTELDKALAHVISLVSFL